MECKKENLVEKQLFDIKSFKRENIILVKNEGEIKKEVSQLVEEDSGAILGNDIEIKNEYEIQEVPEEIEIKEEQSQEESQGILECTFHKKIARRHYICLKCTCSKKYLNKFAVYSHIRTDHYGLEYKCMKCNKNVSEIQLKPHLENIHQIYIPNANDDAALNNATESHFEVSFVYAYREYFEKLPNNNYICVKCARRRYPQFDSREKVLRHIRSKHQFTYSCPKCHSRQFYSSYNLNEHLIKEHLIKVSTFKPDVIIYDDECDNEAVVVEPEIPSDLDEDELLQLENKLISTVSYSRTYKKNGPHNYTCVKCTKHGKRNRYRSRTAVFSHIRRHHFGFRYICKLCSRVYNALVHINNHLNKVHEINDVTSRHNNTIIKRLTESEITKLENQEYSKIVKPEIQRKIPQKDNAKKNIQTHTKSADNHYICLQCNDLEKFDNLKSLNIHRRIYHNNCKNNTYMMLGEDHYICLLCKKSKKFKNTRAIYNHRKTYHSNAIKLSANQKYVHTDKANGNNKAMLFFIEKEESQIEYEHFTTIGSNVAMSAEHTQQQEEITDVYHWQSETKNSHMDIKYEEELLVPEIVIKQEMPFTNCNNETMIVPEMLMTREAFIKQEQAKKQL